MIVRYFDDIKMVVTTHNRGGTNTVESLIKNYTNEKSLRVTKVPNGIFNDKNVLKVDFVRNPYTRVISSFHWFYLYSNNMKNYDREKFTFIDFLDYLYDINIKTCNPHYMSQIDINKFDRYDHRFKIETDIKNAIEIISKHTGKVIISGYNDGDVVTKNFTYKNKVYDVPFYRYIKENKYPPIYSNYYDNIGIIKEKVDNIYGDDIEMLGYDFNLDCVLQGDQGFV